MPNATMTKFGYPATSIQEYRHWCVLLRPAQATLGAVVLVCKDAAGAFSDISAPAFAELADVTKDIETALPSFRPYQKINYLMLMMVDPDVHFHVLPRYDRSQMFEDMEFPDPGWPGAPDLSRAVNLDDTGRDKLVSALKGLWPGANDGAAE